MVQIQHPDGAPEGNERGIRRICAGEEPTYCTVVWEDEMSWSVSAVGKSDVVAMVIEKQ